jgi:hypothetical protein
MARLRARGIALRHYGGGVGHVAVIVAHSAVAGEGGGSYKSGEGELEKKWGWRGRPCAHEALANGRAAFPSAYSRQVAGAA